MASLETEYEFLKHMPPGMPTVTACCRRSERQATPTAGVSIKETSTHSSKFVQTAGISSAGRA